MSGRKVAVIGGGISGLTAAHILARTDATRLAKVRLAATVRSVRRYHGWGFHEDGCRSGAAAARALGGAW